MTTLREPTLPFLLEVGCEEIPARFLLDAEKSLGERVHVALTETRLLPSTRTGFGTGANTLRALPIRTFSTPRRLAIYVPKLLAQQPDKVEEILGPPVKVAFDAEGKYTRAAESFAQKNSAALEDLARTTTPKGEYLSLRKTIQGRPARDVLASVLPQVILGLSFPKSMYWTGKSAPRFVRPIRWVLALLGEGKSGATVDFEIVGVTSGNFTFGHRVKTAKPLPMNSFKNYTKKLKQAYVEIDKIKRRERVIVDAQALLEEPSLKLVQDEWLTDWVVNSTEWPRPVLGTFDERFLHLPREILIRVMRDHQRYFAVEDQQGSLTPHFVAVLNVDSDPDGIIRRGHQRVVTARFRDAEFFWNADQRVPLRDRLPLLDKVTYQVKLGSYGDKIRRMLALAGHLCEAIQLSVEQRAQALRAVELCKCDLTTQMVQEFTELQGVVGGLYAKVQGEPEEVAAAIYDHYLPMGTEGESPRSLVGQVVSLADKLDTVVGGFVAGYEPTGSRDPFALRRAGNGIIKLLLEYTISIRLDSQLYNAFWAVQGNQPPEQQKFTLEAIEKFMRERLTYYLENVAGLRYDTVRAAMGAASLGFDPLQVMMRARAVEKLRASQDFMSLSQSAKRIRNILRKSAKLEDYEGGKLDLARLEEGPEHAVYEAYARVAEQAERRRGSGDYDGALEIIASLRIAVDTFFEKVLVMAEDPVVRMNRLQLLFTLDRLFSKDADLSEIEEPGASDVGAST
jgi:glycyl-tRNA synthetase beta chain